MIARFRTPPGQTKDGDPPDARIAELEAQLRELVAATRPIARQAVLARTKDGDHTVVRIEVLAGQIRRCWRALAAVDPGALPMPRDRR
jgi:hypothetical protein